MFNFFRKKNKSVASNPDKMVLHGHNLAVWNFLGFLDLKYNNISYPVFLFSRKDNSKKRSYSIPNDTGNYVKKYHTYVSKYLDPWKIGEKKIYTYVSNPSDYLKEYMLEHYACVWDQEKNWWTTNAQSKYDQTVKKQNNSMKTESSVQVKSEPDTNVVKVEFNGQRKN